VINFKLIQSFYSDDHKGCIANTAKLEARAKNLQANRVAVDASIANEGDSDPNPEARIAALAAGRDVPPPPVPLLARRLEIMTAQRDCDEALDYLAGNVARIGDQCREVRCSVHT
jgi:hypothetical protein